MKFELELIDSNKQSRIAILDTEFSKLYWKDNNKNLISEHQFPKKKHDAIIPISHENPGHKSKNLKSVKIQLGFACNFTCNYCSQNSLRDKNQTAIKDQIQRTENFINKLPAFFGSGDSGDGTDVSIEFWGGETLIYWESVKLLTIFFRNKFPKINLGLFTNGSLITQEMADFAAQHRLHFVISHDGPSFSRDRSRDPLDSPMTKENIIYMFNKLSPLNLISFNATISVHNHSLVDIANYIANKLNTHPTNLSLHYELATPYDQQTLKYVVKENFRDEFIQIIYQEFLNQFPFRLNAGNIDKDLKNFYNMFSENRPLSTMYQKCNMDNPTSLALDLEGNVLTCQNVTANAGHKIGELSKFENIQLNTSTHFLNRDSCLKCPVVNICKGSCMFLQGEMWEAACEQHYTWSLALLACAIKLETDYTLTKINGSNLRNKKEISNNVII